MTTPRKSDRPRPGGDYERLFRPLRRIRPLLLLAEAAGEIDCHLIGGALRDTALGIRFRDLDLVIEHQGLAVARQVASRWPARLIELGGDRFAAYRLVADRLTLDIWDLRGGSLEADLARRDLTIHSFALELLSGAVIDPFQGLVDLENKILRATTEASFSQDPLRVLRLARFAGQLPGFSVAEPTRASAAASSADLTRVASERIRSELDLLMDSPDFLSAADLLVRLRLYPGLWLSRPGRQASSREDGDLRSRLEHLESVADRAGDRVERASARHALLFACLSSSVKSASAFDEVDRCQRLGLLAKATAKRAKLLLQSRVLPQDEAARRWFLHVQGSLWPTAACVLAATAASPCPLPEFLQHMARLDELCRDSGQEVFDPEWLLTGDDLVADLGLPKDRNLGRILSTIQRRQVEGRLATRQEALALAKRLTVERADTSE